jgi:drug/metabolite transporter (DMT)-like permease
MTVSVRVAALTSFALLAFAFNSVLTRLALGAGHIDAASFTAVRLLAGAATLGGIVFVQARSWTPLRGSGFVGPAALFAYAAPFSFAYLRIGAAVGALVLFGVVQITMIGYGALRGERPPFLAWGGAILAAGGLFNLTLPAVARPDTVGVLLMAAAGVAWGVYSLAGRTVADPVASSARNFLWSSVPAVALWLALRDSAFANPVGMAFALLSGAVTSGIGYAIWYRAVRHLSAMQAAVAQMTVPVIASIAAVGLLKEQLTGRVIASGAAVLTGVAIVLLARSRRTP